MKTEADVIISGAGPAGSMAAWHLASRGIRVLILEKSTFPRYKVCGAGLTHKVLQYLPFEIEPILETSIHTVVFSRGFRDVFSRSAPDPIMYCTMRGKLDAFLLSKALEAGARAIHGEKVKGIRQEGGFITVSTRTGEYRSRLMIGADGASGITAHLSGLRDHLMPGLAWEAEVTAETDAVKSLSDTVFLDWGAFPGGYGWVFPKADHLSVGVGGPASLSKQMLPYFDGFMEYFGRSTGTAGVMQRGYNVLRDQQSSDLRILSMKSWPIPVKIRKSAFHNGSVLVAGDAAGLTDPLTGEGIYYAIRSGQLAAVACADMLNGSSSSLKQYTDAVNTELMNELLEANRISHIFNSVPVKIHAFVRDSDRAWRAFGKVLRGERGYADVRRGFGKWQFLWGAACLFAGMVSEWKLKRFRKKGFGLNHVNPGNTQVNSHQ